jgi:transcriptional regulator with XRE-family HTH domain
LNFLYSPTSLNRLELGHHSVSAERLAELATLLNVRADYLCGYIPFPLPLRDRAAAMGAQQAP